MDDLLRLNTLYCVKKDGRKKARTVLGAGKTILETLELNYGRTHSPTARPATFRILCALAAMYGLTIRGGDVSQAYAQAKWPEGMKKVYAHVPSGYKKYYDGKPHCVEVGQLYGNPPAGKNWWIDLRDFLKDHGFQQSEWDPCYFVKRNGEDCVHLIVYVDDILTFSAKDSKIYDEFERDFTAKYTWNNFGTDLHDFVSIDITQKPGEVKLGMDKYIDAMAAEFFPAGVHHAYTTPAESDLAAVVYQASIAKDTTYAGTDIGKRFRRMTMQLLYLSKQVRPDIALATVLLTFSPASRRGRRQICSSAPNGSSSTSSGPRTSS